jgi:ATP adenylyltransferase
VSYAATKRDRDDTDFRGWAVSYKDRELTCLFCKIGTERIIDQNALCFAIRDAYPVSLHHTLIIPKRHVANLFELYQPELNAIHALLREMEMEIRNIDQQVTAFNMGINIGNDAGQTVFHMHVHLIPRRHGDVKNPRGGVRGVIPDKQDYS